MGRAKPKCHFCGKGKEVLTWFKGVFICDDCKTKLGVKPQEAKSQ